MHQDGPLAGGGRSGEGLRDRRVLGRGGCRRLAGRRGGHGIRRRGRLRVCLRVCRLDPIVEHGKGQFEAAVGLLLCGGLCQSRRLGRVI